MKKRKGLIKFGGQDVTIIGEDIQIGQIAPDFTVTAQNWSHFNGLKDTSGKVRVLAAVPSLDTAVCDRETRTFNQQAADLGDDVQILTISADLPFAQKRWCGAAGIDRVVVLSDHQQMDFGEKYACLIQEKRLLRRAVFVVDRADRVVYADYMSALGDEPDYNGVLDAVRSALG